jgi:hypothetical protein
VLPHRRHSAQTPHLNFSSWTFLSLQLGGILSLLECIFLSRSLFLHGLRLRISFMIEGPIFSQIFALTLPFSIFSIACLSCYFAHRNTSLGFSYNASATLFGDTAPCIILLLSGIFPFKAQPRLRQLKHPPHNPSRRNL